MTSLATIAFSPLVPLWLIGGLSAASLILILYGLWRRARGIGLRTAAFAFGLLTLANPVLVEEERDPVPDVAVVVVDESPSQDLADRRARTARATEETVSALQRLPNLDVRVVRADQAAPAENAAPTDDGTRLFDALQRGLSDTPRERFAGAVMITDGQVHDAPGDPAGLRLGAPIHTLLTGDRNERDRRIAVEQAPAYGIVGHEVQIGLRVEDPSHGGDAAVTMRIEGGDPVSRRVPVGQLATLPFKVPHGGTTFIELEVEAAPNELTLLNNRTVVAINGVRDRLRVLLVSGEPHAGERVWRNLLKADPSVDLVHFTILRPPEKQDGTPIRELSLIAFPVRELFELKINEFDLIIFDRYKRRGILPTGYYQNIADYVKNGGALLEASGPAFAQPALSLGRTPLSEVLPARPTGRTRVEGFRPELTDTGRRHPVTSELPGAGRPGEPATWGRWFQMVDTDPVRGNTLMAAFNDRPLLQLDRVGKGRVAQMTSDHAWLWARGFQGGGPQAEMLRRIAHWLMKEPDLEEEALTARVTGGQIEIQRRSLKEEERTATVTRPDGSQEQVRLAEAGSGRAVGTLGARLPGMYRIAEGDKTTMAVVGAINPKELSDVRTTPAIMQPVAAATGGAVRWLTDGLPEFRRVSAGRDTAGRSWLGLVSHNDYTVTGIRQYPLLPALLVLFLLVGAFVAAWRREGR
jgi:uncharacterized membrane protein